MACSLTFSFSTCKLKISSCNISHCEYSGCDTVWRQIQLNLYEAAAKGIPKVFLFLSIYCTSRCIAVIPSPIEGIYQMQFPQSCSHGLAFSDTVISGACQKCATKSTGQYSFMILLWKCNDEVRRHSLHFFFS